MKELLDNGKVTKNRINSTFIDAANKGSLNVVVYLHGEKGVEDVHKLTALRCAVSKGHFEVVRYLVGQGAWEEKVLRWAEYFHKRRNTSKEREEGYEATISYLKKISSKKRKHLVL